MVNEDQHKTTKSTTETSEDNKMIQNVLGSLRFLGYQQDTDFVDRLHSFLSTNALIAFSILVSWKQFGGKPIECMVPDTFTSAWEQYCENYCWSKDTYFLPFDEDIPVRIPDRESRHVSYYQWVPFFLLFQAICFRIPSLVWKLTAGHSGIKIHDLIELVIDKENTKAEVRKQNIQALKTHLQNALKFQRRLTRKNVKPHKFMVVCNLPYSCFYVTTMYLVVKLLYLLNVLGQLVMMNRFLQTQQDGMLGFSAVLHVLQGHSWEISGVFPRVSMCDFQVRVMANVQRYTVQCVLVINLFNEKIFVLLWFWFMLLLVLTSFSCVFWFYKVLLPWPARQFVSRQMELSEMPFDPRDSCKDVERFVSSYLKADGVFVLRMITMHGGVIFGSDLTMNLWKEFYPIEEQVRLRTPATAPPYNIYDPKQNMLRLRKVHGDNHAKAFDDSEVAKLKDYEMHEDMRELQPKLYKQQEKIEKVSESLGLDMPDSRRGSFSRRKSKPDLKLEMPKGTHNRSVTYEDDYKTARTSRQLNENKEMVSAI